jgi:hypothetical protein
MNWGRGFFRAWIAVSALWIGFAVLISKPATYALLWKAPRYEIELGSGQRITLDTSMRHSELVEVLERELNRERSRTGSKVEATTRDGILEAINSRYGTAGDQAWQSWLVTLVPPVVLLGLGLCIAWILSGFRRTSRGNSVHSA